MGEAQRISLKKVRYEFSKPHHGAIFHPRWLYSSELTPALYHSREMVIERDSGEFTWERPGKPSISFWWDGTVGKIHWDGERPFEYVADPIGWTCRELRELAWFDKWYRRLRAKGIVTLGAKK
jgi:hypothetical protein